MFGHRKSLLIIFSALALCLTWFAGCTHREAEPSGEDALQVYGLSRLPSDTIGFLTVNFRSPAFKKYQGLPAPMVSRELIMAFLADGNGGAGRDGVKIADSLFKSGLVSADSSQKPVLADLTLFAVYNNSNPLPGIICHGMEDGRLGERFKRFVGLLRESGVKFSDAVVSGATAISFNPSEFRVLQLLPSLVLAANDSTLVLTTTAKDAGDILNGGKTQNFERISTELAFRKSIEALPQPAGRFIFGFLDLGTFLRKKMASMPMAYSHNSLPIFPEQVPPAGIAFQRTMGDAPRDEIALGFEPDNNPQKAFFARLKPSGTTSMLASVPSASFAAVTIDGALGRSLNEFYMNKDVKAPPYPLGALLPYLKNIGGVAVSLRSSAKGAPFPELAIEIQNSEAEQLIEPLRSQISQLVSQFGIPGLNWADSEVAGQKVFAIPTPFGVGVFLTALKERLLLTSSADIMQDSLSIRSGAASSIISRLEGFKGAGRVAPSILSVVLSWPGLIQALHSHQTLLGMIGAQGIASRINFLGNLGITHISANMEKEAIKLTIDYYTE